MAQIGIIHLRNNASSAGFHKDWVCRVFDDCIVLDWGPMSRLSHQKTFTSNNPRADAEKRAETKISQGYWVVKKDWSNEKTTDPQLEPTPLSKREIKAKTQEVLKKYFPGVAEDWVF